MSHPADEAYNYELVAAAIKADIAAPAGNQVPLVCDFDFWGQDAGGPKGFFWYQAEREVNAWLLSQWENEPHKKADTVYRMGLYGGYGGYATVWFGRAEDETLTTLADVRVFVDASRIPNTAVLKYYRRAADGSEAVTQIPLADLPHSEETENGSYLVDLPGNAIVVPKVMIWAG